MLRLFRNEDFIWKDGAYKRQTIKECEKMAAFYPAYLKEHAGREVVLSSNALKILRLQAEGYCAGRIAEILGIAVSTVKYHNHETYKKLGVSGKAAAVHEARNWGLL